MNHAAMSPSFLPHVFLCPALAVAMLTTGCGKRDGNVAWWQGEQERIELTHRLALDEFRLEHHGGYPLEDLEVLQQSNQALTRSVRSLKLRKLALAEEIESMEGEFAGFRDAILRNARYRLIGTKMDELASLSGKVYKEVTVASIDDAGVTIRHADGSARLRCGDLDASQRLRFGLDAELALAAVEKESRDALAYARWLDDRLEVLHDQQVESAEQAREKDLALRRQRSMLAARDRNEASMRPLAQPATSFGTGGSRFYSSYRSYRPTRRYVYYTPSCTPYCSPNPVQTRSSWTTSSVRRPIPPSPVSNRTSFANTTLPSVP